METPKKRGRKPFTPTPEQRETVTAAIGLSLIYDEIRLLIINPSTGKPISKHTLIEAFPVELENGKALVKIKVLGSLYKNATEHNNVAAQIFMAKTRYGWVDPDPTEAPETLDVDMEQNQLEAARRVAFMLARGQKQLIKK